MLAAFQRKTKFAKSKVKETERKISKAGNQLSVKFQSDYPTEVWEKSPSPSPTSSQLRNNIRLKASPSSFQGNMNPYESESSSTSSSTSSLDEIVFLEKEKQRKQKTRKQYANFQEKDPINACTTMTTTSSSSDHSSDCSSLDWPLDEGSTAPATRHRMPRISKEINCQQPTKVCQSQNMTNNHVQTFRYPPSIHVPHEQPHLVYVTANYFPSTEWQAQYQVMPVNCGEYVYVDKQPPRTEDDINRGAASWVLVRKLGSNLILSQPGFIPRHLTRVLDSHEVYKVLQNYTTGSLMNRSTNQMVVTHSSDSNEISQSQVKQDSSFEPTWAKKLGTNLPYNPNYDLNSCHQTNRINSGVYSLELEDKDSGRGPSSGSEWSASKYGSFAGLDEHELDPDQDQFSEKSRPEDFSVDLKIPLRNTSQESSDSSPPNLPPPMKPLSCDMTPKLIEKLNCVYISESKVQFATPLILRHNNVKIPGQGCSNISEKKNLNYEPYKTIVHKDEKKLETFTRV